MAKTQAKMPHSPTSQTDSTKMSPSERLKAEFGLAFNEAGVLKQIGPDGQLTEKGFEYHVHEGSAAKNQRR